MAGSGVRPSAVTGAGVLVMVLAAVVAARFTPFWFDPDEGCALRGRCPGPATDAVLRAMWVVEAAGFAVVLLGLVRTGRRLATTPAPPVDRPFPAWGEAPVAALTGVVLCAVPGWFVLVGALLSVQAIPAGLCLFWLLHAAAVTALDRRVGPARASALPGWLAGLVTGAVAVMAVGWWAVEVRGPLLALPVVDGAVLALGVLVRRAGAGGAGPRSAGIGAVAVLASAAVALVGLRGPEQAVQPAGPPDAAVPRRPAVPTAAPTAAPPAAIPTPAVPPVDAAVACTTGDLTWSVTGWDAAMGTRAVTVVAISRSAQPCYVDGIAGIAIAQGGRDLRLTTQPGSPDGPEAPQPRRVALAPGDAAAFPLVWKGYGAAADEDTPQELRVVLPQGGGTGTVPLGTAPAPFDLVDGGAVRVGPWRPSTPT